jgi:putative ABC transport system permease protein
MLDDRDRADRAPVVVVNQAFARRYFPNGRAIGERISITRGLNVVWREIVGVVGDVRHRSLSTDADPEMYVPFRDDPVFFMRFAVSGANAESLAAGARASVWDVDKNLPVTKVRPLEALVAASVAQPRFHALLVGGFAALALVLAAIGLYGSVARLVAQRTREIGVRSALGASPWQILGLVGRHVFRLVTLGLLIGLAGAVALTRTIERFLFGVPPTDEVTFAAVTVLFAAVAAVAAWLPARRALAVDPVEALRAE